MGGICYRLSLLLAKYQMEDEAIVRDTIREIGYSDYRFGFDADTVAVITSIHGQSPDIAQGVL